MPVIPSAIVVVVVGGSVVAGAIVVAGAAVVADVVGALGAAEVVAAAVGAEVAADVEGGAAPSLSFLSVAAPIAPRATTAAMVMAHQRRHHGLGGFAVGGMGWKE